MGYIEWANRTANKMFDNIDAIMVTMLIGMGLLIVFLVVGFIMAGGDNPCPDGLTPIREIDYYMNVNGTQIPVYETVGCG